MRLSSVDIVNFVAYFLCEVVACFRFRNVLMY
nr:MAG TPA: hypothetical protein [Caudoviricetes sp.]